MYVSPYVEIGKNQKVHKEVQKMNKYEIALILSSRIDDETREKARDKIKSIFGDNFDDQEIKEL